ncbi:MAG: NusG domain II-containing protein [Methylotenera sp.]|uniref:NusG domain II-containing protein n=1 Tax=Methylotenera sp. TaxID=2051956 RepID=UPI00272EF166|nr:NusG domain II-containing protein [Methylotenera sp.]MDP2070547.1 NusG domain II-containing protein [Methylotenera sp.]MDP3819022.1 NusG domain II-containing protein [Methylotenera sp.]
MLNSQRFRKLLAQPERLTKELLLGDWLVVLASVLFILLLFKTLWSNEHAAKVQIRLGDKIYATYSLNQQRDVHVHGPIGSATISISQGKVRFSKSPCHNQYCVHQGWLTRAGQAAICLPNQISLELLGETKPYDSLNY